MAVDGQYWNLVTWARKHHNDSGHGAVTAAMAIKIYPVTIRWAR